MSPTHHHQQQRRNSVNTLNSETETWQCSTPLVSPKLFHSKPAKGGFERAQLYLYSGVQLKSDTNT